MKVSNNIFCEIEAEAMKKGKLANLSHITSTQNLNTIIGLLGEVSWSKKYRHTH